MTEPVPTPLDVAVEIDPIERHKFALSHAVRYGHADNPDSFADRLKGDTREEIEADAAEFAETIAAIRAELAPPHVPAVDPSQGLGYTTPRKSQRDQFADVLFNALT